MAHPEVREMVPDFVLETSDGKQVQLSGYRGRRNLLLIFLGRDSGRASELLASLSAQKHELEAEETTVLVLVQGDVAYAGTVRVQAGLPFAVLADQDGSLHQRYGALVVLTDRYGEIYSVDRDRWPSAEELMTSVRHINAECPE